MHRRPSAGSAWMRFFTLLRELRPGQVERFTHVEGVDRVALAARAPDVSFVAVRTR